MEFLFNTEENWLWKSENSLLPPSFRNYWSAVGFLKTIQTDKLLQVIQYLQTHYSSIQFLLWTEMLSQRSHKRFPINFLHSLFYFSLLYIKHSAHSGDFFISFSLFCCFMICCGLRLTASAAIFKCVDMNSVKVFRRIHPVADEILC